MILRIRAYHLTQFYLVRNKSHVDTFSTVVAKVEAIVLDGSSCH